MVSRVSQNTLARKLIFFAALLAMWQAVAWSGLWAEYIFPSPLGVARTLVRGFQNGTIVVGIVISMQRLAIGYGISAIVGILGGLAIGRSKLLDETVGSLVMGLQTLPSICWLPFAVLWFSFGETPILFVVIMGALLAITTATEASVKNTSPLYLRAARNLGARGGKLYALVIFPAALPGIITGMKLGWSFAWRSLMAAELLSAGTRLGLGYLLDMGRQLNDMERVMSIMLIIIAIGLVVDRLIFAPIETRVRARWGLMA
jgi:NitT/TauT family transport system permease protein